MAYMTLKEMADAYLPMTDDMVVLRMYLSQPENMDKGIELLATLCQREIKDLNRWKKKQTTDGFFDFSYYYQQYDIETAAQVEMMTRKVIAEVPLLEREYQWAIENLSGSNPQKFYYPLKELLTQHGVDFLNPYVKPETETVLPDVQEETPKKKRGRKPKTKKEEN